MNFLRIIREKFSRLFDAFTHAIPHNAQPVRAVTGDRSVERRTASKRDRILYYAQIYADGVEDRRKNYLDRRMG